MSEALTVDCRLGQRCFGLYLATGFIMCVNNSDPVLGKQLADSVFLPVYLWEVNMMAFLYLVENTFDYCSR